MQDMMEALARELGVRKAQVEAAVTLFDSGATVPFVARYRKEATGGLDDVQLRLLDERLTYLRELVARQAVVRKSIADQGKLTPALDAAIGATTTKQALEDLYLPYKPKRRTKAQIALGAGLGPLADALWADPTQVPEAAAAAYVQPAPDEEEANFTTVQLVLDGARDILSERWAEDATVVQGVRAWLWQNGQLASQRATGDEANAPDASKFQDYFDYAEPLAKVPSHRALAVFRGRALGVLDAKVTLQQTDATQVAQSHALAEDKLAQLLGWRHAGRAADDWLRKVITWTWRVKLQLSSERDVLSRLREQAEAVAIEVFANNLRDLLLAAPAGPKAVLGLDPGIRTGVKVAVVDATGKVLDTTTVYPHEPRRDWDGSVHTLCALCIKHGVTLIAIGNGTASRETDQLAADVIKRLKDVGEAKGLTVPQKAVISEAGASVYSASEFASQELPQLDVSLRGAVSIARRLQDPLAELVKIDPKSIGVGQYQHDVNQVSLAKTLDSVVEDCVNAVGVDVNTASAPLLSRVSGLSASVAASVVRWRDANGAFASRQDLLKVTGLGAKTFEQAAGFLRIRGGTNPLDMTGVHPESYPVVERMLKQIGQPIHQVMGAGVVKTLKADAFVTPAVGLPTVRDILVELEKPGRDPRPDFAVARFNDGINQLSDVKPGMILEGTVTNVAQFGAFVDIGAHQDGLVHVSQMAKRYVGDARDIVKTGEIVKVKVLEVDVKRGRMSLSFVLDSSPENRKSAPKGMTNTRKSERDTVSAGGAMAAAFSKLNLKNR